MIQNQMNLELSVDTESVKTTVDASFLDDDEILPYCVGYIPWNLMQQSTLWAWRRYQYDYSYDAQTASITPLANPYDSDDALQAKKGVPFCYAANDSLPYPELKAVERLPDGTFTTAGDSFQETYSGSVLKKNLIAELDLSKITKTVAYNNLSTYIVLATAWEVVTAQGDGPYGCYINKVTDYDFKSGSFTPYTASQSIGSPVNDTLSYLVNSTVLDRIGDDGAPYEDQVTVNGYTVKLRTYCIGFRFSCRLVGSNVSYAVNGMTVSDLLYRYTPMMGVQTVNGVTIGSCPCYSNNSYIKKPTEIGRPYSKRAVSDTGYINIGRDIVGDSFTLDNNGKYAATENGMRYKDALQFWIGFKSFNAMDLRIMGLITTPVYTDANGDSWCPEFTDDYALTGNWVPYVDQVIDPEENTFDPEDIPEPVPDVDPVLPDIRDPIMVYPPQTRDFSMNGICTLRPVTAVHELNYNQAGEITLTHPFDADGKWQSLVPNNIILAPLTWHGEKKPQAFRIYRRVKQMDSSGKKTITVYARHVFYDLMYSVLRGLSFSASTPRNAIETVFSSQIGYDGEVGSIYNPYLYKLASDAWYSRDHGQTMRNFDSEIGHSTKVFDFQELSIASALIGDSSSIASVYNLELYVDNFYFSLYVHANNVYYGHVLDDSFHIRYAFDMQNVSEDVDYTNAFTHLMTYDNVKPNPTQYGLSTSEEAYGPFARPKSVKFSYNNYDTNDKIVPDTLQYYNDNHHFVISYTAKYAPIDHDKSRDFLGQLDGREVGDTGTVTNSDIGIVSQDQRIIYKKTDLLTGIVLDIKLGNAPASITRANAWSKSARSTAPSAVEKQIEAMQSS